MKILYNVHDFPARQPTPSRTRLTNLPATAAWAILLCVVFLTEYLFVASSDVRPAPGRLDVPKTFNDARLYEAVAGRVRHGEDYYAAAALELNRRGYPTGSTFNWRMPSYAWIFGSWPWPDSGRAVLIATTLLASAVAGVMSSGASGRLARCIGAAVFLASCGWVLYPEPAYFMEFWSGLFLLFSCYMAEVDRWEWCVLSIAVALALRELAFPFAIIALVVMLGRRRWGAVLGLCFVMVAFLAGFAWHSQSVARQAQTAAPIFRQWITFGGGAFVVSSTRMNYLLALLPGWCAALYLPLALLGLAGTRGAGYSLAAFGAFSYTIGFLFVGMNFNFYWGWMPMPLLVLGFVQSPRVLRDLWAAAWR